MNKEEIYAEYLKFVNENIVTNKTIEIQTKDQLFSHPIENFDIQETKQTLVNDLYFMSYVYFENKFKAFVFYQRNEFIKNHGNLEPRKSDWFIPNNF